MKRSREEVMMANAQAIKRKEMAKLQEKEEEEAILAYQVGRWVGRLVGWWVAVHRDLNKRV